jgi:probable rRNA maturation factor
MKQVSRRSRIAVQIADRQNAIPLDRRLLRRAVAKVLRRAGVREAQISLAVVDDDAISQLNWRFLRHRGPADVLSFLLDDRDALEGEVVVGAETAVRTAADYGWPPHDELLLYVVHGMLHLVGYDDRTTRQRREMKRGETEVLQKLGIERR